MRWTSSPARRTRPDDRSATIWAPPALVKPARHHPRRQPWPCRRQPGHCVSTWLDSISASVQCRSRPSIIEISRAQPYPSTVEGGVRASRHRAVARHRREADPVTGAPLPGRCRGSRRRGPGRGHLSTTSARKAMASITDRTILIVGASTGIGAEVARRLGHGGNRLVATARRDPELAALARDVRAAGSACLDIPADALDPQAAADVGAAAVAEYGSIDIALLNAGQGPDMSMDDGRRQRGRRVTDHGAELRRRRQLPRPADHTHGKPTARWPDHPHQLVGRAHGTFPAKAPTAQRRRPPARSSTPRASNWRPRRSGSPASTRLRSDRPGQRRRTAQALPGQHGARGTLRHTRSGKGTGAGVLPLGDGRAGSNAARPARFALLSSPPEPGLPIEHPADQRRWW